MSKYVAFLRAINVGGHTVKMETLRALFVEMNFENVETFIASGNVIFETKTKRAATEQTIAAHLEKKLGYAVATFLRDADEMQTIAQYKPFSQNEIAAAGAFNLAFLAKPLDTAQAQRVMALQNPQDRFHLNGRELYWLCTTKQSDSKFSNAVLEKTIRAQATLRGMNTISKLAAKHFAA